MLLAASVSLALAIIVYLSFLFASYEIPLSVDYQYDYDYNNEFTVELLAPDGYTVNRARVSENKQRMIMQITPYMVKKDVDDNDGVVTSYEKAFTLPHGYGVTIKLQSSELPIWRVSEARPRLSFISMGEHENEVELTASEDIMYLTELLGSDGSADVPADFTLNELDQYIQIFLDNETYTVFCLDSLCVYSVGDFYFEIPFERYQMLLDMLH
jgi:hypothetical protein